MKTMFLVASVFCGLTAFSQNYTLSFEGSGATTSVATVTVENLSRGTKLTINGSSELVLTSPTGILDNGNYPATMRIYPNPMAINSILEFIPSAAGDCVITIYDMTGKPLSWTRIYLENSRQYFSLSGLKTGFYIVQVKGKNYKFSGRLLSTAIRSSPIRIEKINDNVMFADEKTSDQNVKGTQDSTIYMAFTEGDRLKLTGKSGNYITVKIIIPDQTRTYQFKFIACTDGDKNNYPVVEIGNQTWMAENLKTTSYNDGTPILNVTDNAVWASLSKYHTPAYCWYNNDIKYKNIYGALYSAGTIEPVNPKNVCPVGWHVAGQDWYTLIRYLDPASNDFGDLSEIAGNKLKERGTAHWECAGNISTNEYGFSALPGGYRYVNEPAFNSIGKTGLFWDRGSGKFIFNCEGGIIKFSEGWDDYGLSVRCAKDTGTK